MIRRLLTGRVGDRIGDYVIEAHLGTGGMGEVFAARHVERRERVALKLLEHASATSLVRFKREFRAVAELDHENLVQLGELVVIPGQLAFFTMEIVTGESFTTYIRRRTEARQLPSLPRLTRALRQLIAGVAHLHAHGCLHRDLKPSNVLITPEGRVVVLDFGLVADLGETERGPTRSGQLLGTPGYMAPEQAKLEAIGPAADAYAIGVMLFEALCGERPFTGNATQMLQAKLHSEPPDPAERVVGIPDHMRSLCLALLQREPDRRPSLHEVSSLLGESWDEVPELWQGGQTGANAVMFGRDDELEVLASALAQVESDDTAVTVHVHGASGLGKSFLVHQFLSTLHDRTEVTVFRGRCYESESMPYKGIDGVIDAIAIHLHHLPELTLAGLRPRHVDALTQIFPALTGLWAAGRHRGQFEQTKLRRQGLGALRELLVRLGERGPTVVFIDDFQWADADSARLLAELVRPPDPPVLLLVVAFRDEEQDHDGPLSILVSATNTRFRDIREVELRPLSEESGAAFALALMDDADDAERARGYTRDARGNPFFIRQMVLEPHGSVSASESLDRVVARRVLALSLECRRLLAAIAVAGGPLPLEVALRASGLGARTAFVQELRELGLITSHGPRPEDLVEAAHDRIREVMVAELDRGQLGDTHRALAVAFEDFGGNPETLAGHFEGGGEPLRALEYAEQAAARAARALAFARAAEYYRRTLRLLPQDSEATEHRAGLEDALAQQLENLGHGAEASQLLMGLARRISGPRAADYERRAADQLLKSGHLIEGLAAIQSTLARVGAPLPSRRWQVLVRILINRARLVLRGLEFGVRDPQTLDPAMLRRLDAQIAGLIGLSQSEVLLTHALHATFFRDALDAGAAYHIAWCLGWEMMYAVLYGKPERVEELMDKCREAVKASNDPQLEGLISFLRAAVSWTRREWETTVSQLEEVLVMIEGVPRLGFLTVWWPRMAMVHVELGNFAQIRPKFPGWISKAVERGNRCEIAETVAMAGVVEFMAGDLEEARRLIHEARAPKIERYTHTGYFVCEARVKLLLWERRLDEARALIERARADAQRWQLARFAYIGQGLLDLEGRCLAMMVTADPSDRRSVRRARRSARRLRRSAHPISLAQAEVIDAALASAAGDWRAAEASWRRAEQELAQLGLRARHAAVCSRLMTCVAGPEAEDFGARARAYFEAEGIEYPARCTETLAPSADRGG